MAAGSELVDDEAEARASGRHLTPTPGPEDPPLQTGRRTGTLAELHHHGLALAVGVDLNHHVALHLLAAGHTRSEEHTSELQSRENLVCRLLLEKKKQR